jgi:hypothetical protein
MTLRVGWWFAAAGLAGMLAILLFTTGLRGRGWTTRDIDFGGAELYPLAVWGPDGTAVLAEGGLGSFQIVRPEGSFVSEKRVGRSPAWIDDQTVAVLESDDLKATRIDRVDLETGRRMAIGPAVPVGRLLGDGQSHLAWRTVIGDAETLVLDPKDGHVIADLSGVRANLWLSDGTLVVKGPAGRLAVDYPERGSLSVWRGGPDVQPIGAGLVELVNSIVPSPSTRMLACICAPVDGRIAVPGIYIVPLDGSPATFLMRWAPPNPYGIPMIAWIDDASLVIIDRTGLTRASVGGDVQPVGGLVNDELVRVGGSGRLYPVRDSFAVVIYDSRLRQPEGQLLLIDAAGGVLLDQLFASWSMPRLIVDDIHERAILVSDPILSRESLSVVEYK